MSKVVFIDVDGTLVDYENKLPQSAVEAIRQARKNGHKVYICTGRSRAEVYQEIWDIGLDGMIGGNGAYVEDNGKVVAHKLITFDQCKKIVDWLHNRKLEFYLERVTMGCLQARISRRPAIPLSKNMQLIKARTTPIALLSVSVFQK